MCPGGVRTTKSTWGGPFRTLLEMRKSLWESNHETSVIQTVHWSIYRLLSSIPPGMQQNLSYRHHIWWKYEHYFWIWRGHIRLTIRVRHKMTSATSPLRTSFRAVSCSFINPSPPVRIPSCMPSRSLTLSHSLFCSHRVLSHALFGINRSKVVLVRTALFWVITQGAAVISHRRFGTTYRFHPQGSWIQKKACSPNTKFISPPALFPKQTHWLQAFFLILEPWGWDR